MILNVNDTAYVKAGLIQQSKGNYIDALCHFGRTNSYEGILNAIICLCQNGNSAYGSDLYRIAKTRFGTTHSLVPDLMTYGGPHVVMMLMYSEDREKLESEYYNEKPGLVHADEALVLPYNLEDNFDELESFLTDDLPVMDYKDDPAVYNIDRSAFFDVNSVEYLDHLRGVIKVAYLSGDEKLAEKVTKRYLSLTAKDVVNLETQLTLAMYNKHYRKASAIAKQALEGSEVTIGLLWRCVEAVYRSGSRDKQLISTLLHKCLPYLDDNPDMFDIDDMIELADVRLEDSAFACTLAEKVVANPNLCSLDTVKCAIIALLCNNQLQQAKELAVKLNSALPFDDSAYALWHFVCNAPLPITKLNHAHGNTRHVHVPFAVMEYCEQIIVDKAKNGEKLSAEDYRLLGAITCFCKACYSAGHAEMASTASMLVYTVVMSETPENQQDFVNFACRQLSAMCINVILQEALIYRLITMHYDKPVWVNLTQSCYLLDLSEAQELEGNYVSIFSEVCTKHVVKKGDVQKIIQAVDLFLQNNFPDDVKISTNHVAYAVLRTVYDDFAGSDAEKLFSDDVKLLYGFVTGENKKDLV